VKHPTLKLVDDTLYVCSNTGIYKKNLKDNSDWELYAFENTPVIEFVRNGNRLLALSTGTKDSSDSLLLLSNDNGQTFANYTSPHFLEHGFNYLYRIAQNPKNSNSILVLHAVSDVSKSEDFGLNWRKIHDGGYQWHLNFHPLDTTALYFGGENDASEGKIYKSSDSGETWASYSLLNNAIYCIAFHPTNPDILIFGGRGIIGKSTDKGETWNFAILPITTAYDEYAIKAFEVNSVDYR
jgi:photosystem II stability/assembly factor-like uncharacterized protein